jgi:hypothetical protein
MHRTLLKTLCYNRTQNSQTSQPLLWAVCEAFVMSEPGSSVRNCSEDAFAAQSSIGSTIIKFNTKTYRTWQQASDAYAALQSKANSVWGRVSMFETGDAGSAEFELHCKKCGTKCQLANPAK